MPFFCGDLEGSSKLLINGKLAQSCGRHMIGDQLSLFAIGFLDIVLSDIIAKVNAQQILDRYIQHLGCLQQLITRQPTISAFHARDSGLIDANFFSQFHLIQALGFSCST